MTDRPILYLGDTSLDGAAAYLAGLLTHWEIGFDYLPSDRPLESAAAKQPRRLYVLSDYPSRLMPADLQAAVLQQVEQGAGLLMIGGWESFCGQGGDWAGEPIGDALPVQIRRSDDRINCDQPALLVRPARATDHPAVAQLPWESHPPGIGGFNDVAPRENAQVLLEVERFGVQRIGGAMQFSLVDRHPLLVAGRHGQGRTAALATDVAPHWVGGLVDWGGGRVTAQAPGSWQIEVGEYYAQFLHNLIGWCMGRA